MNRKFFNTICARMPGNPRMVRNTLAAWFLGTFCAGYGYGLYLFWPIVA